MLRRVGAWQTAGISLLTAGLLASCKPAAEPIVWETVEGPRGLFTTALPVGWGELVQQPSDTIVAFATPAAVGTHHDRLLLQRRAIAGQSGLLITFERIWPTEVPLKAWVGYLTQRAEIEVMTHNQLTDRSVLEHVRDGQAVTFVIRHQSFGSRGFYEVLRMEEREGLLMTARLFVPQEAFWSNADALKARLGDSEWSAEIAAEMLPQIVEVDTAALPSI